MLSVKVVILLSAFFAFVSLKPGEFKLLTVDVEDNDSAAEELPKPAKAENRGFCGRNVRGTTRRERFVPEPTTMKAYNTGRKK